MTYIFSHKKTNIDRDPHPPSIVIYQLIICELLLYINISAWYGVITDHGQALYIMTVCIRVYPDPTLQYNIIHVL